MYALFRSSLNLFALSFCLSLTVVSCYTAESRIVDGTSVNITNVPYLVSIRYKHSSSSPFIHRCSATIYSADILLTTARCVIGLKPDQLQIVAGTSYRSQSIGFVALVDSIIIQPDFNIWYIDNDLAILRLKIPLSKSDWFDFEPIAASSSFPKANSAATVPGWGDARKNGINSQHIKVATVLILSQEDCQIAYGNRKITEAMMCAGSAISSGIVIDACEGDAGSPLESNGNAVGLVSWSSGCGHLGYPEVYTNLVYFKQWIESVAKQKF